MPGLVMGETQERQNDLQLQQAFLTFGKTTRLGKPDDLAADHYFPALRGGRVDHRSGVVHRRRIAPPAMMG